MEIKMNNLFSILLFAHLLKYQVLSQYVESEQTDDSFELEPPLILTPFLEDGDITEAKERARVEHSSMKDVESYSGYFTVNKEYNSNLFFWYFPSKGNPETDPVVLWLQGGPGSTSLFGLFTGNGPFTVTEANTLELRDITWANNHNLLYIDSPVGSGYSFTEAEAGYATSVQDVAIDLYSALHQFFLLFPELRDNEFYLSGESYAGKYVPALGYVIHQTNKNLNTKNKMNLVGLAIGNGLTDPINQYDYPEYLYQLGFLDSNGREIYKDNFDEIKDLIIQGKYIQSQKLLEEVLLNGNQTVFYNLTGYSFFYNLLYTDEPQSFIWHEKWVQQLDVRKAIHVGSTEFFALSKKVSGLLIDDRQRSVAYLVAELLEHYRVLLYFGQLDLGLPLSVSRKYVQQLNWSGSEEYKKASRNLWYVENELAGYTKCARKLTEVVIRNSGHMVPTDQPLSAWTMISHFTRHKSLC